MPLEDFDMKLAPGHLLRRCHQISQEIYNSVCGKSRPTRQQFATLLSIYRNPAASIQDLAAVTAVDRNTLVGIISRLADKGLITTKRSSRDSRAYDVRITPEGTAILLAMEDEVRKVQEEILAPLSPDEREAFVAAMAKLCGVNA